LFTGNPNLERFRCDYCGGNIDWPGLKSTPARKGSVGLEWVGTEI
jgi:hypothetical protein